MGGRLALWYHIYGYGWRYGIISTVMVGVMASYLRFLMNRKNIQTNNLISENILSFHQFNRPPVSSWTDNYCFDVYGRAKQCVMALFKTFSKWWNSKKKYIAQKKRVSMGIITEIIVKFCIRVLLAIICKSPYLIKRTTVIANGIFWTWKRLLIYVTQVLIRLTLKLDKNLIYLSHG